MDGQRALNAFVRDWCKKKGLSIQKMSVELGQHRTFLNHICSLDSVATKASLDKLRRHIPIPLDIYEQCLHEDKWRRRHHGDKVKQGRIAVDLKKEAPLLINPWATEAWL